jgi:hypothetical protein
MNKIYLYNKNQKNALFTFNNEVNSGNKSKVNSASSWFLLYGYIPMHGQQNIKFQQNLIAIYDESESRLKVENVSCYSLNYVSPSYSLVLDILYQYTLLR